MTFISEDNQLDQRTPIQQFYKGQTIFITGGTGSLGKILIEKLLRSCSDLSSIYLLIRPKRGQDIHERIDAIFDDPIFDRLKNEVPKFRQKIVPIPGDCALPGLGISSTDRELLLREISLVFNVAATMKFDEKIRHAVAINISGPKETMELCRRMYNLRAVIHVSTAYSNCTRRDIDEKFYAPPISGDKMLQLVQSLDDEKLDAITGTLLGDFPNIYAYTKCIAEQVVQQHSTDLPIGIYRPAMVIPTYKEPIEGWIDNVYGPTGAVVSGSTGLLRTLNMDKDCITEVIPADFTVNALIATAWDVANNKNEAADPPIYNYHSSWTHGVSWGKYLGLAFKCCKKIPSIRSVWCYSLTMTTNYALFCILNFLFHVVPAFLIDAGLLRTAQKSRLLKDYITVQKFSIVTSYFTINEWQFGYENMKNLWDTLTPEDQKIFYFSMANFDWEDYMQKCVAGLRVHIFKDDPSTIPMARKRMAKFLMMHRIIKWTSIAFGAWLVYVFLSFAASRFSSLNENILER